MKVFQESYLSFKWLVNIYYFKIHQVHEIDLVDVKNVKIEYKGKSYQYILSLLDTFCVSTG